MLNEFPVFHRKVVALALYCDKVTQRKRRNNKKKRREKQSKKMGFLYGMRLAIGGRATKISMKCDGRNAAKGVTSKARWKKRDARRNLRNATNNDIGNKDVK